MNKNIVYRIHALERMSERGITGDEIRGVLSEGETIENYPDDKPFPSYLKLGFVGARPVHVVAAENEEADETVIITVYEPDRFRWDLSFTRRRAT